MIVLVQESEDSGLRSALLKELSDEELVLIAKKQNDNEAVVELINRVSGFISCKANQFASSSDLDKQDFYQQGLMGVISAIRSYDAGKGAKFSTFACHCAINSMISLYSQQTKKSVPTVALDNVGASDYSDGTYDRIESYELLEEVAEKIKTRLSEYERKVLAMYVCGVSYADIATQTGKPVKSVDNAVQRIRRKLKAD